MEKLVKPARLAFCIRVAGMVIPQLFYGSFGNNFIPGWHLPAPALWVWLFTILVIIGCVAIVFSAKQRMAALLLGGFLLGVYIFGYFTYDAFIALYNNHLGTWADGLKESALAGGAFIVAVTLPAEPIIQKSPVLKFLEKLVPFGPLLFCLTMVLYGLAHIFYTQPISTLIPDWIPGHIFWTYFAGIALMASGLAITFKVKQKTAALLLALMIFIWLFLIHIPRALHDPYAGNSNEPVSAFSALAFCAIAVMISGLAEKRNKKYDLSQTPPHGKTR